MFIGRTDADVPLLWPPDAKSQLMWKDSDAQKNWTQKEKRAAEDQMVRQHHQLNGYESEQTLGDSEGQGAWQSNGSQSWPWLFVWDTTYRLKNHHHCNWAGGGVSFSKSFPFNSSNFTYKIWGLRGRWEGGSGWETHVNPWLFYSNVWQNSLQIKKKKVKKKKKEKAREFQKSIYFCIIDCATAFNSVGQNWLWKILKQRGIPDHLTCLLRNLYAGHAATIIMTWNNRLVPNRKRSRSRLYIFTLLI